ILHAERVAADQGRRWNPVIQLDNTAQLPPAQHRGRGTVEGAGRWYLPNTVDGCAIGNVEVRGSAADLRREPEPACDRIREGITRDGCRTIVHRLAVCVRASELEAVAQPLLDIHCKGPVSGAGSIRHESDGPEVRVDPQILSGGIVGP